MKIQNTSQGALGEIRCTCAERRGSQNSQEAEAAANSYRRQRVVKAQIHAGGRGKGGGVKVAQNAAEAGEMPRKFWG